jgi:hypothetical protein
MAADVYTGELRDGRTVDLYGWELDGDGPLEVTYVFEVTLPITQLTRRDFQTVNIDPSLLKHTMATELQTCAICLDEIAEDCGAEMPSLLPHSMHHTLGRTSKWHVSRL